MSTIHPRIPSDALSNDPPPLLPLPAPPRPCPCLGDDQRGHDTAKGDEWSFGNHGRCQLAKRPMKTGNLVLCHGTEHTCGQKSCNLQLLLYVLPLPANA